MTSTNPIIEVNNVSKIFAIRTQSISLRHEATTHLKKFITGRSQLQTEKFYALKDINFSIQQGEAVGIVGHNGAGKTTLLRLLARIIRPSVGQIWVRGSYVSLLGIGSGFNETMSGRKNIYLNAAIHGINPHEIQDHVEEIIEFAEIGKFIDMPIKDYSSGMQARLGFSIAIHILPDIVFLDEILAVGDISFMKKSRQRLETLLADNRTVIMVSHSNQAVVDICARAIWLHKGEIQMDGDAQSVVAEYDLFMKKID